MDSSDQSAEKPRVLCLSADRETRATMARAFAETDVVVAVARSTSNAVEGFRRTDLDAIVVDAGTVEDVSDVVDALDGEWPGTPTFVRWEDPPLVTEVVGGDSSTSLPDTVTSRLDAGFGPVLNDVVEEAKRRLADASTPTDVERAVREAFLADERFGFSWLGEYDRGEREVVPWLPGSTSVELPVHRTFAIGDGSQPVLERSMQTDELQVVEPIASHADAVPLGEEAAEAGFRSVAAAPLAADDRLFGVLVLYGTTGFGEPEREAISSVAETASYALESIAMRGRLEQVGRTVDRYEDLVEAATDGMYVLDDEGHFTTVNDGLLEMTGYTREGLLGEHSSLLFGEDGARRGTEEITRLLKDGGSAVAIEVPLETKAGETIPVETQVTILVRDGGFEGSVGVVRDITDRRRRERQLREQNERLDAFARIVSHDLRNPLGVSQGYLDLLEETESFEYVGSIRDGLERMEAIIADVLAIAREGEWASEVDAVDLEEAVREAWENVSTEDATVRAADTTTIEADRSRLLRMLENLIRNAVEHGGSDVTVRVGALESDSGFFFEDDGRGMDPEIREMAFDPDVSTAESGFGIGLWVVEEVAHGHGWTAEVTESGRGGARFEFRFDE